MSDLAQWDEALGDVLKHATGTPAARVLAVLIRGLDEGIPAEAMRLWIRSRSVEGSVQPAHRAADRDRHGTGAEWTHSAEDTRQMDARMRNIVEGRRWRGLLDAARVRASSSSDDGARRRDRLERTTALMAGLLLELPGERGGLPRNAMLRAALAVVGARWLQDERGFDSVLLSHELLSLELGCSARTADRTLEALLDAGILTRSRGGQGVTGRYRIVRLRDGERRSAAGAWKEDIRALVDGDRSAIAAVILSVTHPAWAYSSQLSHRHWLMLLADVAGIDPERFGIRARMAPRLRAELTERYALTQAIVRPLLTEILDRLADDPECGAGGLTARARRERAEAKYKTAIAERRAEREAARDVKRQTWSVIAQLLEAHPIPKAPSFADVDSSTKMARREAAFMAWVEVLHAEVIAGDPPEEFRSSIGAALTRKLVTSGYGETFADGTARFILRASPETTLAEWLAA
ncbi:hypothetical protein [Pseudolysinimonas sp.]|uniref:hypothetical protein n=1 Tax=Pseudolysinimonas sp. TaxID=2680009 RepID=UPI003F7D4FF8